MKRFNELKHNYQILAFDYTTKKEYVYDDVFETYDEAMEAMKDIDPPSTVCGLSINEVPVFNFSDFSKN